MTDFYMSAGIVEISKNTADGRETSRHIAPPAQLSEKHDERLSSQGLTAIRAGNGPIPNTYEAFSA